MSSFPGLKNPFLALSLLAVAPDLKGVLIGGASGTGKSQIARSAQALFPKQSPFVNVPLGCSMERLIGGIDIAQSQESGTLRVTQGLLAKAHRGILYVDEINLLSTELITAILHASMQGVVRMEREGFSYAYPTDFALIGTYNPAEHELPAALRDRIGLLVFSETITHLGWRMVVASRAQKPIQMPADLISRVSKARNILPNVTITEDQLQELCSYATQLGVQGNRLEILATRCAKANAALHLRAPVTQSDIYLAIRLIYMSRLGDNPIPMDKSNASKSNSKKQKNNTPDKDNAPSQQDKEQDPNNKQLKSPNYQSSDIKGLGDQKEVSAQDLIPDWEEEAPPDIDLLSFSGSSSGTARSGKHHYSNNNYRGRHVKSVPGVLTDGRLDILATLKSAALHNVPNTKGEKKQLNIRKEDFRIKRFQQRSGLLFIFAVDGSGSMAINHFQAAKGAALSLLEKAYVYRDQVALIYFRHKEAKLLLAPGCSITGAAAALKRISSGGKTPLGSAMLKTLDLVRKNNVQRHAAGTVLILFTDGKANQPHKEIDGVSHEITALSELKPMCSKLRDTLSASIVFDTRMGKMDNPYGQDLAAWLGAEYIRIPKATTHEVMTKVGSKIKGLR